jgi:hypothetical protein
VTTKADVTVATVVDLGYSCCQCTGIHSENSRIRSLYSMIEVVISEVLDMAKTAKTARMAKTQGEKAIPKKIQ